MSLGMSWGPDELYGSVTKDVVVAVQVFILERMVEVRTIIGTALENLRPEGGSQFVLLHQESRLGEMLVASAMVYMQVGVDDIANITRGKFESFF